MKNPTPLFNFHSFCSLTFLEADEKYLCNLSLMTIKVQSHYLLLLNSSVLWTNWRNDTLLQKLVCSSPFSPDSSCLGFLSLLWRLILGGRHSTWDQFCLGRLYTQGPQENAWTSLFLIFLTHTMQVIMSTLTPSLINKISMRDLCKTCEQNNKTKYKKMYKPKVLFLLGNFWKENTS